MCYKDPKTLRNITTLIKIKNKKVEVDSCLAPFITALYNKWGVVCLMSCCGHHVEHPEVRMNRSNFITFCRDPYLVELIEKVSNQGDYPACFLVTLSPHICTPMALPNWVCNSKDIQHLTQSREYIGLPKE